MKSEIHFTDRYRQHIIFLFLTALFTIFGKASSQELPGNDSLKFQLPGIHPVSIDNIRIYNSGYPAYTPSQLIPSSYKETDRTMVLLDSLKSMASKKLITRKLYDFIIIPRETAVKKEITIPSDVNFQGFSGKTIRKIEIRRLNVFGTDIYRPAVNQPNNLERFLNNTHINTNEAIIRKNILFGAGDTVSPLILSDNERLLRQLPFIDDARIMLVPTTENQVDVIVLTKDIYSIGARLDNVGIDKGSVSLFDRNIFGMGHEFGIEIPYDSKYSDSPGFGVHYLINNFRKTFVDLNLYYLNGVGKNTFGFDLGKKFVSSATKYAGGISFREMFTSDNLDTMLHPAQVKYNLQDYWIARSFLADEVTVSRFIFGVRYVNNNVYQRPYILPESFHRLQRYKIYLGSVSFSMQKYYKANLIYGYGRTEDIPYGGLVNFTFGREINEFKERNYLGASYSIGQSVKSLGYFYGSAGFATFYTKGQTEQGMFSLKTNYISNLLYLGKYRNRNFLTLEYTRGFDRYTDESLVFNCENGFSGFRNDTVSGAQRLSAGIESVLFSPVNFYGFRFAVFGFADVSFLFGPNEYVAKGNCLSAIGLGVRIRNDNLILNTLQIRLGFFPNLPDYSSVSHLLISGEQLMRPSNFEPGPPALLPYK